MSEASETQPLITPRKLITALQRRGTPPGEALFLPGFAVLTTVYPVYSRLTALCEADRLTAWSWKHPPFCIFKNNGVPAGVLASCPLGAPQVAILIEELAVFGVHTLLFLGFAGGIGKGRQPGDILVPPCAYVGEGTSGYYGASSMTFANEVFSKKLLDILYESGIQNYGAAPVWTTDALYRETGEAVKKFSELGAAGVDMETSAVFGVARALSVKAVAALWISDLLTPSGWQSCFYDARFEEALTTGLEAVRDFCLNQGAETATPVKS